MNLELLTELDRRLSQVEAVLDGRQAGDIDVLLQQMRDRAANAAGRDSPEYGLALRAGASVYRNRGEHRRAADEYRRAVPLLERAGDEGLIWLARTFVSLIPLHLRLKETEEAIAAARRATDLMARYAQEPKRYAPPEPHGQTSEDESGANTASAPPRAEDVLAALAGETADAMGHHSPGEGLRIFDQLLAPAGNQLSIRLAVLLARASFATAHEMKDEANETFDRAWTLANSSDEAPALVLPGQWVGLGRLAISCNRLNETLEAARRLRELPPTDADYEFLLRRYDSLQLEAAARLRSDDSAATAEALRGLYEFCASAFGREAEQTVAAESTLGDWLVDQGRPHEAVVLLQHAANWHLNNANHPSVESAAALFRLGWCLDKNGADIEAISYYAGAYRIYSHVCGPDDPRSVNSALNLAETSRVAGDGETAEHWFRIALDSERRARGNRTRRAAHAMNNLAGTLLDQGRTEEAVRLAEDAFDIRRELCGEQSRECFRSLEVLAQLAMEQDDRRTVSERLDRLQALAASLGDPGTRCACDILRAKSCARFGEYERAIEFTEAALQAAPEQLPLPETSVDLLFNLGRLHARLNHWKDARQHLLKAFASETAFLSYQSAHRSRRQVRMLLSTSRQQFGILLTALTRASDSTPDDIRNAYEVIQQRKSAETRLLRLQKPTFLSSGPFGGSLDVDEADRQEDRLHRVREEMSSRIERLRREREELVRALIRHAQHLGPDPEGLSVVARQDRVELLERELASFVGEQARYWELFGITSTVPVVPDGSAVVEYVLVDEPVPAYYAFVIGRDSLQVRPLGEAGAIHEALQRLRIEIIDFPPQADDPYPPWRRRARFLANRLLKPLLDLLGNCKRMYVVPDSELFTLPFELLPLDDDTLAIDRWIITYLWYGGELRAFNVLVGNPPPAARPVVVSVSDFTGVAPEGRAEGGPPVPLWFAPLPFADREGEAVAGKTEATHLRERSVTKEAVVGCSGAEILHLATHSFYIARAANATRENPRAGPDTPLFRARSFLADPMDRSGIALPGADYDMNAPMGSSSGILFGSDVLDMDLRATDLVVLSSCQSGLGDPHCGDGIQGLRRAFRAAGARTVVSSLWKVPDETTYDLMMLFYDRLLAHVPRGQALHEAKLTLRRKFPNDPLFWAGFVLDGWDRQLFRFDPMSGFTFASATAIVSAFGAALDHIAAGRWNEAVRALHLVLDSETAQPDLKAGAAYELAGVLRRTGRLEEALKAYDELIQDIDTPAERRRSAIADRGLTKVMLGDLDGAYLDYTSLLNLPELPDELRAYVLVNRSFVLISQGNPELALADCNRVLSSAGSPPDQRLKALLNRADLQRQGGRYREAKADATALIEMPESAGSVERAQAYLILALCRVEEGQLPDAIAYVRRHLENRVTPSPPAAADTLASCAALSDQGDADEASSRLYLLIAELIDQDRAF